MRSSHAFYERVIGGFYLEAKKGPTFLEVHTHMAAIRFSAVLPLKLLVLLRVKTASPLRKSYAWSLLAPNSVSCNASAITLSRMCGCFTLKATPNKKHIHAHTHTHKEQFEAHLSVEALRPS